VLLRLLYVLFARATLLSTLLALVGLIGPATLPALERPIKFDEKGLMAGAASPSLRFVKLVLPRCCSSWSLILRTSLSRLPEVLALTLEMQKHVGRTKLNGSDWLQTRLQELGLEVYASSNVGPSIIRGGERKGGE
jgi:hypothetical protein